MVKDMNKINKTVSDTDTSSTQNQIADDKDVLTISEKLINENKEAYEVLAK